MNKVFNYQLGRNFHLVFTTLYFKSATFWFTAARENMAEKMVKKHNKEDEVLSKKDTAREDDQTSTLTKVSLA